MRTLIASTILFSLVGAQAARGATFVVPPGPGTPVQDAIDAASDGDTIRLTIGDYPEHLVITKAIKIRGVRSSSTGTDTTRVGDGCGIAPTIRIFSNGVQLRAFRVVADSLGGIDLQGDKIKLTDVVVLSQCANVHAPLVNVEQSTRVKLNKVWPTGSDVQTIPAAIRIANTPFNGRNRVHNSLPGHADVGVLLEDNDVAGNGVRVSRCAINFNRRGILLRNTTGATVDGNKLVNNDDTGIEAEADSSGNRIFRNTISGSIADVVDAAGTNCWQKNTYTTGSVPACP